MHGIQIWHVLFKIPRKDKNEAWDNRAHRREMEGSSILRPTITRIISWEKNKWKVQRVLEGGSLLCFSSILFFCYFVSLFVFYQNPTTSSLILPLPPSTLSSLALPLLNFSWLSAFFCSRSLSLSYPCPVSFMQKIRFIY